MSAINSGLFKRIGKGAAVAAVTAASLIAVPVVKQWEGRSLVAYYDIANVLTYCDGETMNADKTKRYTDRECDALTQARVEEFATKTAALVEKEVEPEVLAALTIFSYNVGVNALANSTALRRINEGRIAEGCEALMKFVCISVSPGKGESRPGEQCYSKSANKKFVKGLWNRRNDERNLCMKGVKDVSL